LNNALKYRKNRVELQLNIQNGYLDISVSDDGEGIPAIYHQKIFECYFQLPIADTCSVRGHGLGLAGVMVLLEDMGGELILESDKGTGATFKVKIPLMED
jgi:signal transduction histidine kinase